jgi:hypothetical protein
MYGARPSIGVDGSESIEPDIAEMALIDPPTDDRTAIAVGRQRIELTRATEIAIAVGDVWTFDFPTWHRH